MFAHLLDVELVIANGKNAAVNERVESFNAPVHDLGEAGDVADVSDGNARRLERLHRAAGADDLDARRADLLCKLDQIGFIRHAYQCAINFIHAVVFSSYKIFTRRPSMDSRP